MAAIYFLREGNGPDAATAPHDVSIELVSEKMSGRDMEYSFPAPRFSVPIGNIPWSVDYRYVVVEVFDGEVSGTFPMPGYYYVVGMTPDECRRMLPLS
jgi:hypothetical protein